MEVLDEFDSEFPQSVTFCQLISVKDFERQAVTYTERALRRLFRTLDRAPRLAERVLRKSKQAECEQRGIFSFLWAKFLCAFQGNLNLCNSMGALEMRRRLDQLKRSIHRVHLYARDAKKKRRKSKLKKPEPILRQDRSTSPCLPPALLPPPPAPSLPPPVTTMTSVVAPSPPVYTMPRVFGPFPSLPSKPMEKLDNTGSEVQLNWNGLSSNPKSHMVDLTPLVLNPGGFHLSYLARNSPHKLHCPGFHWTSASSGSPSSDKPPECAVKASIFTPPVLFKFQPLPRPKDDSENSPGSAESTSQEKSP
ncbi:PREDICTED: proline-rich receptor-like protein kinase PERK2 isoform X2 [Chinchilla lanigera]|nr:PREDICTED: proline-rich receptor-like protein kinase PERK2 isoform X2 [Chinchilla lanigera]